MQSHSSSWVAHWLTHDADRGENVINTIAKAIETGWIVLVYDCPEKLDNNIDMLLMQKSNNVGAEEGAEFKVQFEGKE